jgi:hypothetical protein
MAINNEKKFCFIHIPKTGGVFIEKNLKLNNDGNNHKGYNELKEKYPEYEFHAIHRNPYDRFISVFCFFEKFDKKFPYKARYKKFWSNGITGLIELMDKKSVGSLLLRPQSDFVSKEVIMHSFEEFENTYEILCNIIGIKYKKLPKENTTTHKNYKEYYTKDIQDWIYKKYEIDFKNFNYGYEL